MAEALKDGFGPDVAVRIARMLSQLDADFDTDAFVGAATAGLDELELMPRARHIARALTPYLPSDPCEAIRSITAALPDLETARAWRGMEPFVLLPFVLFVAEHGLGCFEESMTAQYEITRRFTAEFSIRAFIEHRYEETMARLHEWTADPDERVRRLVSEGSRPQLPWAPRLRRFQLDPTPVIELLEVLKDDPSPHVRRSVANNLNDIAKDHPEDALDVAERWWADGDHNRRQLVRHGLRTLIKRGDPAALAILGYTAASSVRLRSATIEPEVVPIGDRVRVRIEVENTADTEAAALVDLEVAFVRADGRTRGKVFRGRELSLPPHGTAVLSRSVSVAQQTTRQHHPGRHEVTVLLNGTRIPAGSFEVMPADR